MSNFGVKLRQLRLAEKLSMAELGEKIKLSQPYISQIESGKDDRIPHPKKIKEIADFFKVPYGFMLSNAINLEAFKEQEGITIEEKDAKYEPWYMVVDEAIRENITPDEVLAAITFMKKIQRGKY